MSTTDTLFPGYKQVESFGLDEDYEEGEEVSYVTLDLGAGVEPTLVPSSSTYRLIGLDTPTPFLQLSGTILKGQHDSLIGSEIIFTEDKADEIDRSKKSLIPVTTTEHRIRFKEVQLKPKSPELQSDPFIHENPAPPVDALDPTNIDVDRITGKSVPAPTRAAKGKGKKKGKQKVATTEEKKEAEAEGERQGVREGDVTMTDGEQGEGVGPPDQGGPIVGEG